MDDYREDRLEPHDPFRPYWTLEKAIVVFLTVSTISIVALCRIFL